MRFTEGFLALTDRRLLAADGPTQAWRDWAHAADHTLELHDHAGVGVLELKSRTSRLAVWRYTLTRNLAAQRLSDRYRPACDRLWAALPLCLRCRPSARPARHRCPRARTTARSAAASTRRRLRPGRCCVCGASPIRIACSCWPDSAHTGWNRRDPGAAYLTMPLMDEVLIPFQNGKPIDVDRVALLMSGLLGAALLAWCLGWARTYTSWRGVSERNRRRPSHHHLRAPAALVAESTSGASAPVT